MDRKALKLIIIELKESGKTFQSISDILSNEYGIHMSRQAVCGMYNRATSDKVICKNKTLILATEDIVRYRCLGLSAKEIKGVASISNELSISDIESILSANDEYAEIVTKEYINKVTKCIELGMEALTIKDCLTYKGVQVTESMFKELLKKSTEALMNKECISILSRLYNVTSNKALVKEIIAENNMNITMKDIESSNNKVVNTCDKINIDETTSNRLNIMQCQ